jgi:hypothetical protein
MPHTPTRAAIRGTEDDLPFHVEVWSAGFKAPYRAIAKCETVLLGKAAFLEAVRLEPESWLMLRHATRMIMEHEPQEKSPASAN